LGPGEAFRQGGQLGPAAVWLPDYAPIVEQAQDYAQRRAAEGLNAIARLEGGAFAEAFDDSYHAFPIEHAGDVMGNGGSNFPAPTSRQVSKERGSKLPCDICKGIAVEEKERGAAMAVPEEI